MQDIVHPQDIAELATIFKTQGKDTEHGMRWDRVLVSCTMFILNKFLAWVRMTCVFITVFDRCDPLKRNFVVRMRCAFTPSVRSIARCSNFKVFVNSHYTVYSSNELASFTFIHSLSTVLRPWSLGRLNRREESSKVQPIHMPLCVCICNCVHIALCFNHRHISLPPSLSRGSCSV